MIFYELDRAGRSVILIDRILKLCQARKIAFVCIKEGIDTARGMGANEIMRIQMMAVIAEGEANRVAERMIDTARYYRDELRIQWGMWPFGFERVGDGKSARFIPTQPAAGAVLRLMALYVAGNGYGEVGERLNKLGYTHVGRRGQRKPFSRETVRTIVGNVLFYAGYIVGVKQHAKQAVIRLEGAGTYLERYARAMKAARSPAIEPLIDEQTASAVIERRSKNEWTGRKAAAWAALLTPIAYWRGKKLRAQSLYTGNWYRCAGRGASFDGDRIDAEMIGRLRAIEFPPEVRADYAREIAERQGDARRRELQAQVAALNAELELLYDLLRAGRIRREHYDERYIAVERQIHEAQMQMSAPTNAEQVMSALHDLARAIDVLAPRKRKAAVAHIFERVDIADDGTVERVHFREWAKAAFNDVADVLQRVPPVRPDHIVCKGALWFAERRAA